MELTEILAVTIVLCLCPLASANSITGSSDDFFIRHATRAKSGKWMPENWFLQKLNHFDFQDERTWQQRFYINQSAYVQGGPIFLMVGGEAEIDAIWMERGFPAEWAHDFGAITIMLEHRYYGKSRPTVDLSTKNLRYLTVEQALADLASFHGFITKAFRLESNVWVIFGGSYAGSLAVWSRYKYPHLFDIAVASGAPLQAIVNFKDYLQVVTDSINVLDRSCVPNIKLAIKEMERYIINRDSKYLGTLFRTCSPLNFEDDFDIMNFRGQLHGNFGGILQFHHLDREFMGIPRDKDLSIIKLCKIMSNRTLGAPLERYAKVSDAVLDQYGFSACIPVAYDELIEILSQTSWNSSLNDDRQWRYQTCTEFGFFQTADLDNIPWKRTIPIGYYTKQCFDVFGNSFKLKNLYKAISWTNMKYGAKRPKASKIIVTNGSFDPWHPLAILKDIGSSVKSFFIRETPHCAFIYPTSPYDPPQLRKVRKQVSHVLRSWIYQTEKERHY